MSDAPLRVAVVGARGRMGCFAADLLRRSAGFEVAAEIGRSSGGAETMLERALAASGAGLGLDLTVAGLGMEHGRSMLAAGVRPVIGTSGVSLEETRQLDAIARELGLGGLVVPNFSLGMWCLQRAATEAARRFPSAEIVELHHAEKRDAPSGTALDTARRLAEAAGAPVPPPIHSLRLPGAPARQEVHLGSPGELLTYRHEALGLEAYAAGILGALRHAATALGVGRGLDAVFGSPDEAG